MQYQHRTLTHSPLAILPTAVVTCQHGHRCGEGEVQSGGGESGQITFRSISSRSISSLR